MDMILLDWTRMGKTYCLAGIVAQEGRYRVVRPLPARPRQRCVRKTGWSPFLLDGYARWDVFALLGPQPTPADPPHLEDVWVRNLCPQHRSATPDERRAILAATATPAGEPLFGAPLSATRSAGYLQPGAGQRSLVTLVAPSNQIAFGGCWRAGEAEPDVRVKLLLSDLGERILPVKDHHLLGRAAQAGADLEQQLAALRAAVAGMGALVAVRLGLSRAFPQEDGREPPRCWLMADGFFSLSDPQA